MRRWTLAPVLVFLLAGSALAAGASAATPWIGVVITMGSQGVLVRHVVEDAPAATAGLRPGDEVLAVDGVKVKQPGQLISEITKKAVGKSVTLSVARGASVHSVEITLAPRPDELALVREQLEGKRAPDLSAAVPLRPTDLKQADLDDHVVVVEFWATWCGPCRRTMPRLSALARELGKDGLRVVGISGESKSAIQKYLQEHHDVTYSIWRDPKGRLAERFWVPAYPMMVVIDRLGVIRHVSVGAGTGFKEAEAVVRKLLRKP